MNVFNPLKPYEFTYRQIIYTGRNYEYMLPIHMKEFENDLTVHKLLNAFSKEYLQSKNPPSLHHKFDVERKKAIDQIITHGQILNLYLIKQRMLTIEYLKLIAWGYTPLPPHLLTISQKDANNDQ